MTGLRLVGYWRPELAPLDEALRREDLSPDQAEELMEARSEAAMSPFPDPRAFIDPTWDSNLRLAVGRYLECGTRVNQFRGVSFCRICGRSNGSAELADGVFCWPEGLAHYVKGHLVRLPDEFVAHVQSSLGLVSELPRMTFDEEGQRQDAWTGSAVSPRIWQPEDSIISDGAPAVEADATWWVRQTGD